MSRRGGDWVPCEEWGTDLEVGTNLAANIPLVTTVDTVLGTGLPTREVGTVEVGSEVIVNRVVGQVHLIANAAEGDIRYIERIRVGIRDNAGLFAFFANEFEDAADANESFLWQRVGFLEAGAQNIIAAFGHPYWSCIDCRVSRRLKDGQALYYTVQNVATSTSTLIVRPFLRSWARTV